MAVNPKLIQIAAETLVSERGRKIVLTVVVGALGIVIMILIVFVGFISGLLDVVQTTDLKNHWHYMKTCLSEVMTDMEGEINNEVKNEVYDFMPDFSVNLSKAVIGKEYGDSGLLLYDDDEVELAHNTMLQYAAELRSITTADELALYLSEYDDDISFSAISAPQFADDINIEGIDSYNQEIKTFLYNRAMEAMPKYEYIYDEIITEDGCPATVQTLNVTSSDGNVRTVEYICVGGGSIYLPHFLAMYNVSQMEEWLINAPENSVESLDAQIAEAVGDIPETAEEAEEYIQGAWQGITDGSGAIKLNVFEVSNLKTQLESTVTSEHMSITTERTDDKLTITLKSPGEEMWAEIFDIPSELERYIEETQQTIILALDEAQIPEEERTLSLDSAVQAALFVYFEGFFELPVDSYELASGSNGILSQYGDVSDIHMYNYGYKTYGVPERGITLELESGRTEIRADLLNCDDDVITYAYIYDVYDAAAHEQDRAKKPAGYENPANKLYNRSAVTIAYVIDTYAFEDVYGFPFPRINNYTPDGEVTLLLEFTCLDELNGITEDDVGMYLEDIFGSRYDVVVGYCHSGDFDSEYDWVTGDYSYYHSFGSDNVSTPHVGIKTFFYHGGIMPDNLDVDSTNYDGPSTTSDNSTAAMKVNPRLWFKGFRTEMSDELLATLVAAQP